MDVYGYGCLSVIVRGRLKWIFLLLPLITFVTIILRTINNCKCSISDKQWLELRAQKNLTLPVCTNKVFREYISKNRRFPAEGTWDKELTYFTPDICILKPADLGECIAGMKTKKIVILGDSNGLRAFDGFRNFMSAQGISCIKSRWEIFSNKMPEAAYFDLGDPDLLSMMDVHKRGCRTCGSAAFLCKSKSLDLNVLHIEYVAFYSFSDNSMTLNRTLVSKQSKYPEANTLAEFLFKVYFKDNYPDAIFMLAPFHHDKMNGNVALIKQNITEVFNLINSTPGYHGDTYWLPTTAESEEHMPASWRNQRYEGMTPNEKITVLNHIMYNILEKDLVNGTSRHHGFFNMFDLSLQAPDMYDDGVHMQYKWYQLHMESLMHVYCNSLSENNV